MIKIPHCNKILKIPALEKYLLKHKIKNRPHEPSTTEISLIENMFVEIPMVFEPVPIGGNGWDGEELCVGNLRIDDVLHEICHYIVAPKSRRKYKDFGLGEGFNSGGYAKRVVSVDFALEEEELVCVLQWILMYNLGYGKYISYTMYDQNWSNCKNDKEKIKKHLKNIIKRYEDNNSRNTNI